MRTSRRRREPHAAALQPLAQPLGGQARRVQVDLRQHGQELLAAVAPQQVGAAQALAQHRRALAQHGVAGQVAVGVVDLLEVVEVAEHHAQGVLVAAGALELLGQPVVDHPVVELAGEAVEGRELVQPLRQPGVVEHQREMAGEGLDQDAGRAAARRSCGIARQERRARPRRRAAAAASRRPARGPTATLAPLLAADARSRPPASAGRLRLRAGAGRSSTLDVGCRTASWRRICTRAGVELRHGHGQEAARRRPAPRISSAPRAASWKSLAAIPCSSRVLTTVAWRSEASRWRATRASTSTGPIGALEAPRPRRSAAPAASACVDEAHARWRRARAGRWSLVR